MQSEFDKRIDALILDIKKSFEKNKLRYDINEGGITIYADDLSDEDDICEVGGLQELL